MEFQRRRSTTRQLPFQQLLKNNDLDGVGIIENPLRRVLEEDLDADLEAFHGDEMSGLAKVLRLKDLINGGRLARDEEATIMEGTLNEVELAALKREKVTRIWGESKELKIILLTCWWLFRILFSEL